MFLKLEKEIGVDVTNQLIKNPPSSKLPFLNFETNWDISCKL